MSKTSDELHARKVLEERITDLEQRLAFHRDENKKWKELYFDTKRRLTDYREMYHRAGKEIASLAIQLRNEVDSNNNYRRWFTKHEYIVSERPMTFEELNPEPEEPAWVPDKKPTRGLGKAV